MQTLFLVGALLIGGVEVGDLASTYEKLKAVVSAGDAAQVEELAGKTCAMARAVAVSPAPEGLEEKEAWSKAVAYAQHAEVFAEYALYSTALKRPAETTVRLLAALERQNPKSKYLDTAYGPYFVALNQTGAAARIPEVAEKALANLPGNEDLLLVLSDTAMARKQTDRALRYAERLIQALDQHPAPEGMPRPNGSESVAQPWDVRTGSLV